MNYFRNNFYQHIIYPLYQYKYGNRVINIFKQISSTQDLSREQIETYQYAKLMKLIKHAYHCVPYYKELMNNIGLKPEDIKNSTDLKYFPPLTKEIIRLNYEKLHSYDFHKRRVKKGSTGGTTGEPLKFIKDLNSIAWVEACLIRGKSWAQFKIGDVSVHFMSVGSPSTLGKIRAKMINANYFSAFEHEKKLLAIASEIKKIGPKSLESYASTLFKIAKIKKNNINLNIKIPIIFSTGEMLLSYQRKLIESQFQGKVFDYYGCNEIGSLAFECEYQKKHISEEHVVIETIDSNFNNITNSIGEITITDLDNYAMPFIRYKNGDLGITSNVECECGRKLKILESLEGRKQNFLRTVDGDYLSAIFFPFKFKDLKGISQYQVIQTDIMNITLKIVKNEYFSEFELSEMVKTIKQKIGNGININIREYKHIKLSNSGKHQLVFNEMLDNSS